MNRRGLVGTVLLLIVAGAPLLLPLVDLLRQGLSGWTAGDLSRLAHLYFQTTILVAGVLALVLPGGMVLALILFRMNLPGRRWCFVFLGLLVFVPLPIHVAAWQGMFGQDGLLPLTWWGENAGRPWTSGMGPAIWVHALASLPWVVFLVGLGFTWVEPELEEEALLYGPPVWVLWRITLPRCRGVLGFAALWIALQTAGDISVTDMMQVPTLAEEIHTQFTLGDDATLARAVLAALPLIVVTWIVLYRWMPRIEAVLPPLQTLWPAPWPLPFSRPACWGGTLAASFACAVLWLPIASLVWKLGQAGHPPMWLSSFAGQQLVNEVRLNSVTIMSNLLLALGTGAVVSLIAWHLCAQAVDHPAQRHVLFGVTALAWALPGPIVGIALKESIQQIVAWQPDGFLAQALYYGPSPLPLAWAWGLRAFPYAVALLWPVVRLAPRGPIEALRLESPSAWREFRLGMVPVTWRSFVWCWVATTALALAEVAASTRVETPGWESFTKLLFDRMHYGVDSNVAALALVMLLGVGAAALVAVTAWITIRRDR